MSTSPVHRLTSTTVQVNVEIITATPSPTASPSGSRRHGNLEGPADLTGRPPSAHLSEAGSSRIRQPLPEIINASPEHDRSGLLRTGERSNRFGSSERLGLEHGRNFSGSITHVSSHLSIEISDVDSGEIRRGAPMSRPRRPNLAAVQALVPKRSWMAVGATLVSGLKRAGNFALTELSITLGVAKLATKIPKRLVGALAGHSIHQTIAVGLPTFAREMIGIGVMHAMRAQPESTALALQGTMMVVNIAAQVTREVRELRRPDVAARAYFSLSAEQWAAKSPEDQASMRAHHRRMSRTISVIQVSASVMNITMMYTSFKANDRTSALRPLANEVKVGVYAAMRDGLQATFSMVGFKGDLAPGISGAAHAASAATYAAANAGSSFLSDALMGAWVPHRGDAISLLMGDPKIKMGHAEAWKTIALGAGVSAMTNTLAETIDWFQRMEHWANQTGATQQFEPKLTGNDYGRLLDQAPARAAAFNGIFSVLTFAGGKMATETSLPPAVQQFIGNVGLGVMIAMLDSPVSGLWQAEDAVREATRPTTTTTTSTVRIEEIDEEQGNVPSSGDISGSSNTENSRASGMSAGNPPERHRSRSPDRP
jgi:hypothetical protein